VGLVGIGVSIVMGAVAQGNFQSVLTKNGGTCVEGTDPVHCTKTTDANTANAAKSLADAGNVVFITGAVLAVGGIIMFFAAPKSKPKSTTALKVIPLLSPQAGGAVLSGSF
jgi:hypothetical protein